MRLSVQAGLLGLLLLLGLSPRGTPTMAGWDRLRGRSVAESRSGQPHGYYDTLIAHVTDRPASPVRSQSTLGPGQAEPPPGWVPFGAADLVEPEPGFLVWRFHRDLQRTWNGTTFRTNALGYRGPEVDQPKPMGRFRIVVLGSSNTLGQGVDDAEAYPRRLEAWLTHRLQRMARTEGDLASRPESVDLVNLAVSGYGPFQRLELLRIEVEALAPDLILCDASPLDIYLEGLHLHTMVSEGRSLAGHPALQAIVERARISPIDDQEAVHRKLQGHALEVIEATVEGLAIESRRLGVPSAIIMLPRADEASANPHVVAAYSDQARRHGLAFLDLSDAFDGLSLDQYRIAPWEHHPSVLGHQRLFETLHDRLVQTAALPEPWR